MKSTAYPHPLGDRHRGEGLFFFFFFFVPRFSLYLPLTYFNRNREILQIEMIAGRATSLRDLLQVSFPSTSTSRIAVVRLITRLRSKRADRKSYQI